MAQQRGLTDKVKVVSSESPVEEQRNKSQVEDIEVVRGKLQGEDIGDVDEQELDPDSAESQNDRDDTPAD